MPDIRYDQGDVGVVNESRNDIVLGVEFDIVALNVVGTAVFGLLGRPPGSAAAITGTGDTRQITGDVAGGYRVRITDDSGTKVIHTFSVLTPLGQDLPAFNERASDDANDVDADPTTWVNESETNLGGSYQGWHPKMIANMLLLEAAILARVPLSRNLAAGAGLVGGGDLSADRTFDVVANADGSIVVNVDDIQVGVLATDAQHGARGGGGQHTLAVLSGAAGFFSGAEKTTLADLASGAPYVPDSRLLTAGAGQVGGGDLSADLTFDVGANADGSIVVNVDDIQVGVLATDAQHGARGGGGQHVLAVASGAAGFFSGAEKQTLIDLASAATPDLNSAYLLGNAIDVKLANGPLLFRSTLADTQSPLTVQMDATNVLAVDAEGAVRVNPTEGQDFSVTVGDSGEILLTALGTGTAQLLSLGGPAILASLAVDAYTVLGSGDGSRGNGALLFSNDYAFLLTGNTAGAARTGGLVVAYDATATADTVDGVYTPGVAAVSNPTVVTAGADTFAAGDILMFGLAGGANTAFYEVASQVGNLLTLRGVGTIDTVEDFSARQLRAAGNEGASITKMEVTIMRTGTDGVWETGRGAVTPITYTDLVTGGPFLPLAGGVMAGAINMGTNAISNAGAITSTGFAGPLTGDVNDVTLTDGGAATAYLDATGAYSVPAGAGGGEANTASNAGTASLVLTKSGVDLPFRGLLGINGIGVAVNGNDVEIDGAALAAKALVLTAGAGLVGGGDLSLNRAFNIGAHADGSIVVNADDVQVGVLATDAQHGDRGGGTQHVAVVAAGASGFMTGAQATDLADLVAAGGDTLAQVLALGRVTGGNNIEFSVGNNPVLLGDGAAHSLAYSGAATGTGGSLSIAAQDAGGASFGGTLSLKGGEGPTGATAAEVFVGGAGGFTGGDAVVQAGQGANGGTAGTARITGGNAQASPGDGGQGLVDGGNGDTGGDVKMRGGVGTAGPGGNVLLSVGGGSTVPGTLQLQQDSVTYLTLPAAQGLAGTVMTDVLGDGVLSMQAWASLTLLHISNNVATPASRVDIAAGRCRDSLGTSTMVHTGGFIDMLVNGSNGLDTGSVAANTLYSLFVIGQPDAASTRLASLSPTAPLLPGPATIFRRVGWILTDASGDIELFDQPVVEGLDRWVFYEKFQFIEDTPGTATSYVNTTVPASNFVPSTATMQQIGVLTAKVGGTATLATTAIIPDDWFEGTDHASWNTAAGVGSNADISTSGTHILPTGPAKLIRYLVIDAETTINVKGYMDTL